MKNIFIFSVFACFLIYSCKTTNEKSIEKQTQASATTIHPERGMLVETVELNATSNFLSKILLKSNTDGYLQDVNYRLGDKIGKGDTIFVIGSKDTLSVGNQRLNILSGGYGYITKLDFQAGDYVQDGETLAEISDLNSLVFLLDLPNELKEFLPLNRNVTLTLPDGQKLTGTITKPMPTVDPVSQTQNYMIKVYPTNAIPGDLIAKVLFVKSQKNSAISLPKEAIITNRAQSEFWIIKMTDSITSVKVIVTKGIETSNRVEILSPKLKLSDVILLTGNYGLPDTTGVLIIEGKE